jgi:hypothetical protein
MRHGLSFALIEEAIGPSGWSGSSLPEMAAIAQAYRPPGGTTRFWWREWRTRISRGRAAASTRSR